MFSVILSNFSPKRFSSNLIGRAIPYIIIIAVSHKDWELPNSQIWLAEIDTESGLDFPI